MHFSLLVISSNKSLVDGSLEIKRMMRPFEETYAKSSRYTVQDDDGDWYNPNATWDWYVIGGRFYSSLKARRGRRVNFDEERYKWYVYDEHRRETGFDWALVSELKSVNPDDFYSVLLPDGTWHDCETYIPGKDGNHGSFKPNPEWDRFEELFIKPYMDGWTATVVDYHI